MLLLASTSDKLQLVTGAAVTVDVQASYVDDASGTITPSRKNTAVTTAATTDIVAAPGASTQRNVRFVSVRNKHASSSVPVTLQHTDGTTVVELIKTTLAAGEELVSTDQGFSVIDANGALKQVTTLPSGVLLSRSVLTSTVGTNLDSRTRRARVRLWACGGGGGGAASAAASGACGAGGGSGGYADKDFTGLAGSELWSATVGVGGTAGANTGGNGGNGGDVTFNLGATTVTAKGGLGGTGQAAAATEVYTAPGAGGAISTNGDVNGAGVPGQEGHRTSAAVGRSGFGGSTALGGGGAGRVAAGAGNTAIANTGSGGGGALVISASAAAVGGTGAVGLIVLEEYS